MFHKKIKLLIKDRVIYIRLSLVTKISLTAQLLQSQDNLINFRRERESSKLSYKGNLSDA